tara:strand:- start:1707 stop:2633 length:927 start_codon:yes stop_codon:yes gene_type:complete
MKFFFIFSLFIIFFFNTFSKNLLAEENFLTLKQQIDRLQREVNDLSKLVFKSPESSNNIDNEKTVNFAAIDMRIYDLEKDIKNLTLSIEELIFKFDDIDKRFISIEEDFNFKLKNLSNNRNNNESASQNLPNSISENEDDNTLGTLKLTSPDQTDTFNDQNIKNDVNQNEIQDDLKENLSPEDQFQRAFDKIRNKNYSEAIEEFKIFIDNNQENQLSGSAHYWLGELYLLEKNNREAALILAEGYQKYPESIKAPEMLYKLSDALLQIGKKNEACNTLTKISKDFSKHKIKNKAEKKKNELSCDASIE